MERDGLNPTVQRSQARRRLGMVFQDPSLDREPTGQENIDLQAALPKAPRGVRGNAASVCQTFLNWGNAVTTKGKPAPQE